MVAAMFVWVLRRGLQFLRKTSIGYTMLAKSLVKIKPADLGKIDVEDGFKLVAIITASVATRDFLVKQKIIPENLSM